jgi:hypothetical protein
MSNDIKVIKSIALRTDLLRAADDEGCNYEARELSIFLYETTEDRVNDPVRLPTYAQLSSFLPPGNLGSNPSDLVIAGAHLV